MGVKFNFSNNTYWTGGTFLRIVFTSPGSGLFYHLANQKLWPAQLWAGWTFRRGFVKIADIPDELMGDDDLEERAARIESQIPQNEREAYEAYWDDLRSKIKVDLYQ